MLESLGLGGAATVLILLGALALWAAVEYVIKRASRRR